jgi:pectinesterase
VNDLAPWAEAVRRIARARAARCSTSTPTARPPSPHGSAEADTLAMPGEAIRSHPPRAQGAAFFARMVARELARAVPALALQFRSRPQLTDAQAAAYSYREVLGPGPLAGSLAACPAKRRLRRRCRGARRWPQDLPHGAAAVKRRCRDVAARDRGSASTSASSRALSGARLRAGFRAPITLLGPAPIRRATRISANLDASVPGAAYAQRFGARSRPPTARGRDVRRRCGAPDRGHFRIGRGLDPQRGFAARNLTFENCLQQGSRRLDRRRRSAGQVACWVEGADRVAFENVRFIGFQDTLYLQRLAAGARALLLRPRLRRGRHGLHLRRGHRVLPALGDPLARRPARLVPARAAATPSRAFGFVFEDCRFTHDGSPNALPAPSSSRGSSEGARPTPSAKPLSSGRGSARTSTRRSRGRTGESARRATAR